MSMYPKKAVVTLLPEWKPLLEQLKEEQFHNNTQAEMFRYIIGRGLASLKTAETAKEKGQRRPGETIRPPNQSQAGIGI